MYLKADASSQHLSYKYFKGWRILVTPGDRRLLNVILGTELCMSELCCKCKPEIAKHKYVPCAPYVFPHPHTTKDDLQRFNALWSCTRAAFRPPSSGPRHSKSFALGSGADMARLTLSSVPAQPPETGPPPRDGREADTFQPFPYN